MCGQQAQYQHAAKQDYQASGGLQQAHGFIGKQGTDQHSHQRDHEFHADGAGGAGNQCPLADRANPAKGMPPSSRG